MERKRNFMMLVVASLVGGAVAVGGYKLFDKKQVIYQTVQEKTPVNFTNNTPAAIGEVNFVQAAELVRPAVVHVKTYKDISSNYRYYNNDPFEYFFREFFGDNFYYQNPQQKQPDMDLKNHPLGFGSGVIISEDGFIVTNNHVIDGADKVEITMDDRRTYEAEVIGKDPTTDLALLKVEEKNLPFVNFGNSDNIKVGEWVLAVGNPFNLTSTVTAGIVSAKGRNINIIRDENNLGIESFIQTDAAVNPGNSGGALVNAKGELIGINTAIQSKTGSFTGYAFAIPTSIAKKIVADLKEFGHAQRAILGVGIQDVDAKLAQEKNLKNVEGVYVNKIFENSAAEDADLKEGDVIIAINGVKINAVPELQEQIAQHKPGDLVKVTYRRDGKEKIADVILKNTNGNTDIVKKEKIDVASALGAEFETLTAAELKKFNLQNGVVVKKLSAGKLSKVGISQGFIITKADHKPVKNAEDISNIISENERNNRGTLIEGIYPNGKRAYYAIGW